MLLQHISSLPCPTVNETTSWEVGLVFGSRWRSRFDLARLASQPEGYQAVVTHHGGQRVAFRLLTPPDMAAVCDQHGNWSRRIRDREVDGPDPYSQAFYQEYLRRYDLPPWFLRGGHTVMLEDTIEARRLGVPIPEAVPPETLSRLDALMPVTPAHPLPREEVYEVEPRAVAREYLGRRFPAVLVDVPSNTYVLPSGHIVLVSRNRAIDKKVGIPVVPWNKIEWQSEDTSGIVASYGIKCKVEPTVQDDGQRVTVRRRLRDAHVADGGIINPTQIPAGLGHWDWLEPTDQQVANANDFTSPEEVTVARGAGALSLNFERTDTPSVVFYPDPEYLNPEQQPDGPGRWVFLTSGDADSDQIFAALNLGGAHGLPNFPTASQIFRLRQQYRAQPRREDLTAQFRLAWIPGENPSDDQGADPVLSDLESEPEADEDFIVDDTTLEVEPDHDQEGEYGVLAPGIHPSDFDPTNGDPGGKLDQTAKLCKPRYYTCKLNPKHRIVTLDRARPEPGKVEEHKTWAYTRKGWQQYTHHAEINWNDKKQLAGLARWRDQLNRRSGWPKLREAPREAYAHEERRWLEDRVRDALAAGQPYDIVETQMAFKAKFGSGRERSETAIGSALLRIKKQELGAGGNIEVEDQASSGGSVDEQEGHGQSEVGEDSEGAVDGDDQSI